MRSHWARVGTAVALLSGLAWPASACGGDGTASATPSGTAPTPAQVGASGTSSTAIPVNSPSAQPSSSRPGPCIADQLTMGVKNPNSAKFQEGGTLVMTNSGAQPCTLAGYLTLQLLGPAGALPTTVTRKPGVVATITLRPGQLASSLLVWNKYEGQGSTCPPFPTSIAVTPPDQVAAKTIPWIPGDSGSVCGGKIEVYPLIAGTTGG